jgi:hypothetical protein
MPRPRPAVDSGERIAALLAHHADSGRNPSIDRRTARIGAPSSAPPAIVDDPGRETRRARIRAWSHAEGPSPVHRLRPRDASPASPASDELRARAVRAGSPGAADRPVGRTSMAEAAVDVAALLAPARTAGAPAAPGAVDDAPARSSMARPLERALDRLTRPAAPSRVAVPPALGPAGSGEPPAREPLDAPIDAPASGLRGLYARAVAAAQEHSFPLQVAPSPSAPVGGAAPATRVRTLPTPSADGDRDLAERIDHALVRLLRREARRHGIDLDGGEP